MSRFAVLSRRIQCLPIAVASLVLGLSLMAGATTAEPHAGGHGSPNPVHADDMAVYRSKVSLPTLDTLRREVDVWSYVPSTGEAILYLDPGQVRRLRERGLSPELDHERMAELDRAHRARLQHQEAVRAGTRVGGGIPGFPCYRTVEETYADLAAAAAAHPQLARWLDIGDSWEKTMGQGGYDHHVLVLGNQQIPGPKPVFLLMAAMHAREYSTAEIATRFALHLLEGYGQDPEATWLLDHREIHVVAQQNPDGRKRAEAGSSWRKNTNNDFCSDSNNRGVDLNRNSTIFWGGPSSSGSQCNELYRGPSAASEPETQTIEDYMTQVFIDQKGDMDDPAPDDAEGVFISLHSFGGLVLTPWESTHDDSPNHDQLQTLGRRFGFYNDYTVCQDCFGAASGTTVDAAYGEFGVAAYTFEVGSSFFQSCSTFESQVYPENLPALIYAAKVADRPYQKASGPSALDLQLSSATVNLGETVTLSAAIDDTRFDSNGNGTEPTQPILSTRFATDLAVLESGGGTAMDAMDGAFDETREDVSAMIDTTTLGAGRHLIFVVGTDTTSQAGPPGAVFLEVLAAGDIFEDGFEAGSTAAWSQTNP